MAGARSVLLRGIVYALAAWWIYWIVECCFAVVLPAYVGADPVLVTGWHWRFCGALLLFYVPAALVSGAAAGVFVAVRSRYSPGAETTQLRLAAIGSIGLAWTWLLRHSLMSVPAFLGAGVALLAAVLVVLRSESRVARLVSDAWFTCLVLVGGTWAWDEYSTSSRVVFLIALLAVVGLGLVLHRALSFRRIPDERGLLPRPALSAAAASLVLAAGLVVAGRTGADFPPPGRAATDANTNADVVLIVMDTVRADYTSLNSPDRPTTPVLANFAREATVYRNAMATSDFTLPTHASMFSGLSTRRHGSTRRARRYSYTPLDADFDTLAEILSGNGYFTLGYAANYAFFMTDEYGLRQGFDFFECRRLRSASATHFMAESVLQQFMKIPGSELNRVYLRADEINKGLLLPALDRIASPGVPYFLFVNYMDAHFPYVHPWTAGQPHDSAPLSIEQAQALFSDVCKGRRTLADPGFEELKILYDRGISHMDRQIGELFDHLKALSRFDNALIIVTSDHGESFGERGLVQHGNSTYFNEVGVPLVIKYPGQKAGHTVDAPVSQIDLLPTILDHLGLPVPAGLDGLPLPAATELAGHRFLFAESAPTHDGACKPRPTFERAIRDRHFKFISSAVNGMQLFNLDEDPLELNNIFEEDPVNGQNMLRHLNTWLENVPAHQPGQPPLDPKSLERLRDLGYIR